MRINKIALLLGLVITAVVFAEVALHADSGNEYSKLTFNEPVQIPGHILPAGSYIFRLPLMENRNIVQVLNADGTQVLATVDTASTERPNQTADTVLVLAKPGSAAPEAIMKWFYPGDTTGHQFMYSKSEQEQLAQTQHQTVTATESVESGD